MDFSFSAEEERFRRELRQWLNDNLPLGWGTSAFKMPKGEERLQFLRDGRWLEVALLRRSSHQRRQAR